MRYIEVYNEIHIGNLSTSKYIVIFKKLRYWIYNDVIYNSFQNWYIYF